MDKEIEKFFEDISETTFKQISSLKNAYEKAKKLNIDCTYINATHSILYELANPKKTIKDLADKLY